MLQDILMLVIGLVAVLIVTITLLGATYAYYRTRVIGNTKDKIDNDLYKLYKNF